MADSITKTSTAGFSTSVNAALGKFDRPINMIIEEETNLCKQKSQFDKLLYTVAPSTKFAEAYFMEDELDMLTAVDEGGGVDAMVSKERRKHYVEHTEFKGDCVISKTLIEDSNRAEIDKRVRKLIRSYWATRNRFAQEGLIKGTYTSMSFRSKDFALKTADDKALFAKDHVYGESGTQSNYFHCVETNWDSNAIAELLTALAVKGRQMMSENGDALGYSFNKIIIPGNSFKLEKAVREIIGSQYSPGNNHNNVNILHGGWQLIVLPAWSVTSPSLMIMSDEANEALGGSMFYDRKPFEVEKQNQFDRNDNLFIHGRARMSLVHNTYKHIIRCDMFKEEPTSPASEELDLG